MEENKATVSQLDDDALEKAAGGREIVLFEQTTGDSVYKLTEEYVCGDCGEPLTGKMRCEECGSKDNVQIIHRHYLNGKERGSSHYRPWRPN